MKPKLQNVNAGKITEFDDRAYKILFLRRISGDNRFDISDIVWIQSTMFLLYYVLFIQHGACHLHENYFSF